VDLDLEKFVDRVNHDRLMAAVAKRVADKRMLQADSSIPDPGIESREKAQKRRSRWI